MSMKCISQGTETIVGISVIHAQLDTAPDVQLAVQMQTRESPLGCAWELSPAGFQFL